jgi:hypothetical protein
MKIHNVAQGSAEWIELRLGLPTASQFHRIVTPKKGDLSTQARKYAFLLIAEKLMHESLNPLDNLDHIARGKELEPRAVKMYELDQNVETRPVGFITTDDGRMGSSPDRLLIGGNAALEIKCPAPQIHLEYLADGFGADYMAQVQGQALIGEFEFVDRYSFHPLMPPALVRTHRDEAYIRKLSSALAQFCDDLDHLEAVVRAKGYFPEHPLLATAIDELARTQGDE